ncbi:MAG: SDR family oxidoreductase [Bacteroidota bacterium]|nr:SDR family oxidoreductase [Bacteroidota bacterium]
MDFGLLNKGALVMASSKGLGKAVAAELANEGCNVVICGRNGVTLKNTSDEITSESGRECYYVQGDITLQNDRKRILSYSKSKIKSIDVLVTNSGGPKPGSFDDHDNEDWRDAYSLLVESTVSMIRDVLPDMKEQKWGRIITITSQAVKQPVEGLILSNSIRSAILGLVKTLSIELGKHNITVNNVLPGYTLTDRLETLIRQRGTSLDNISANVPLKRVGLPNEFAAAVAFLASEKASYITGVSLPIDGGWIKGI